MKAFRKSIVAFALLLTGSVAGSAGTVLPLPGVTGPSLGDPTTNIFSIMQQLQLNTFSNFTSFTSVTVASGPTTGTLLAYGFNFLTAASGTTASVVLPQAKSGADLVIANNTGQGLQVFASIGTSTLPGVGAGNNDSINGTFGGTAYVNTSLTAKVVQCFVVQLGSWWCMSGV